jgi:ATP-dependent exoDNAse (exonuclease V) beta subunit
LIAHFHAAHSPLAPIIGLDRASPVHAAAAIRRALLIDGYGPTLSSWGRALTPSCDGRSVRRLTQLVELAERYESDATLRSDDFVAYAQATPVEDPNPAPIRVMTIHKAKGLEFDIVVLPELTKLMGRVDSQSVYVLRGDPTGPITAIYRAAGKTARSLSPQLADGYAQELSRRLQDDLGSLYVAMTRARHALHLIVPALKPTQNGQPGKCGLTNACSAAILRQALRPADLAETFDGGQMLYSHGDPAWSDHVTSPARPSVPPPPPPVAARAPSSPPAAAALSAGRSWRRVTPSSLESAGVVRISDLLDLEPPAPRIRGSIMHAWFAQIEYLDPAAPPPDADALRSSAVQAVPPATPIDEDWLVGVMAQFQEMLARPARALLDSLSRPQTGDPAVTYELWRERAFAVRLGDRLLAGRFDRVMVYRRGGLPVRAELLDYKTDRLEPGGADAAAEPYRPQMQAYRQALCAMLGLPAARINTALLFVTAGVRHEVDASDQPRL